MSLAMAADPLRPLPAAVFADRRAMSSRLGPQRSTERRSNIRVREIVALEQQRFGSRASERVGEAVAEIEARRMPAAAAVIAVGLARDVDLFLGDRLDSHAQLGHQIVEAASG